MPDRPLTKFALLTMPGTGSTALIDALSSHPSILCYPTVFGLFWNRLLEPIE